jgi:hypothetical protein
MNDRGRNLPSLCAVVCRFGDVLIELAKRDLLLPRAAHRRGAGVAVSPRGMIVRHAEHYHAVRDAVRETLVARRS